MKKELKFEKLGKKERALLLLALDIDKDNLKCQFCNKKVVYDECCIMPAIETKQLATITCSSPLCISTYLTAAEDEEEKEEKTCPYCGEVVY